jgi:transposase
MSDTELLPKSEPVRRLEVFTGAGRRRRWSAEQKARIIAESYAKGDSVCAVARRHGLSPQQLFAWRRHARRQAVPEVGEGGLTFAPVMVEAVQPWPAAVPRPSAQAERPTIEIVLGAALVRVPPGADLAMLQVVLAAVRSLL